VDKVTGNDAVAAFVPPEKSCVPSPILMLSSRCDITISCGVEKVTVVAEVLFAIIDIAKPNSF
jgi:hypothetical protein